MITDLITEDNNYITYQKIKKSLKNIYKDNNNLKEIFDIFYKRLTYYEELVKSTSLIKDFDDFIEIVNNIELDIYERDVFIEIDNFITDWFRDCLDGPQKVYDYIRGNWDYKPTYKFKCVQNNATDIQKKETSYSEYITDNKLYEDSEL